MFGARKAGYSDGEIADYLASKRGFDVGAARKAGYSDQEILGHLAPEGRPSDGRKLPPANLDTPDNQPPPAVSAAPEGRWAAHDPYDQTFGGSPPPKANMPEYPGQRPQDYPDGYTGLSRTIAGIGRGLAEGYGSEPLGMGPETTRALRNAGVFPPSDSASDALWNPLRAINESVLRPASAAIELPGRLFNSAIRGYQEGVLAAGLPRDLAAAPEAFPQEMMGMRGVLSPVNGARMPAELRQEFREAEAPHTPAFSTLEKMAAEARAPQEPAAVPPEAPPAEVPPMASEAPPTVSPPIETQAAADLMRAHNKVHGIDEEAAQAQADRLAASAEDRELGAGEVPPGEPQGNANPFDAIPREPTRLTTFLIQNGGLRDSGGDVRNTIGAAKQRPGLLSKRGMALDDAAVSAWEAGYFPELGDQRPTVNDLLEKLDEDQNRGRPQYSHYDELAAQNYQDTMARNAEIDRLAAEHGIPTNGITRDEFFDQLADRLSQNEAADRASMAEMAHMDAYREAEQAARDWIAYHGTPHDFDQFDISKIGTGEGAQAYGHGLYFAENPGIAAGYRDRLAQRRPAYSAALHEQQSAFYELERARADLSSRGIDPDSPEAHDELAPYLQRLGAASQKADGVPDRLKGNLLTVRLRAKPEEMLDWDKPLNEQSPKIQEALQKVGARQYDDQAPLGSDIRQWMADIGPKETSRTLHDLGIKGIRYLDAGSRADGEGSHNVVMFDHNDVDITHRNGIQVEPKKSTPRDIYGQSQARTLKDLEHEYQQEAASAATQQRAPGAERPEVPGRDTGEVQEGGGLGGRGAGPSGRDEAQGQARGNQSVTSFTTAKGSTYEVHEDGTTTRNKSDHTAFGHDASDVGGKPRSERTIYVDPKVASELSGAGLTEHGGKGFRLVLKDGKASLVNWNAKEGRWGVSPSGHNIPFTETPEVGKSPVEAWKPAYDVPGYEAYRGQHAGNAITEVGTAQARDLLGRPVAEPTTRAPAPTLRTDPNQSLMPGMEPSARQAQEARDAQGRGALQAEAPQKPLNEGLFAPDTSGQTTLYSFPAMLADKKVWGRMLAPLEPATRPIGRAVLSAVQAAREVKDSIGNGLFPMRGVDGFPASKRAQAFAADFANALRRSDFRFGEIDREIERAFKPDDRVAMGRALDRQSVFEQTLRDLPLDQHPAARAAFDASGEGLAGLPPKHRQVLEMLDKISQDTWRQMQERGMVDPKAQPLPYYFPRQILNWSEEEGFSKFTGGSSGSGRGIDQRGGNLTTAGPMSREHLTPEGTVAGAKAKLGQGAVLLEDIRSLPARLAYANKAIAGVDLMKRIEEIGKDVGVDTVVHGDIPGLLDPGDYFTMADHPAFRRWTGTGWQATHVAKEFEGPLKAILTMPSPRWYRAAQGIKGGVMHAIMFSPFIHLSVELGRALPVMPGKILTFQWIKQGSMLRRDLDYMDTAIRDGISPIGRQGWRTDPVSLADQANVEGQGRISRAIAGIRDSIANGAGKIGGQVLHDIVQHPHQTLLWDQVFNLQMSIYDTVRGKYMEQGYAPDVAGTMAAHVANRFAGALPPEHLSRTANMLANTLLFSRSFTLGNLGVMKDMFKGAPPHVLARIEQMAGPAVAAQAKWSLQKKAISAVVFDAALFYAGNALLQLGLQTMRQVPSVGLPQAAQNTYDDWLSKASAAMHDVGQGNPMSVFGVLPQHWNEPGKQDRVFAGTDSQGRGVYLRLPPGKIGEEFLGWFSKPGTMLVNKASPLVRPIIEDIWGQDSLGRPIYKPDPQTLSDWFGIAGAATKHIIQGLGPTSFIEGLHDLYRQNVLGQRTTSDPGVTALKIAGPLTGLAQVSAGYPGGPAAGELHAQSERQRYDMIHALPDIRQKLLDGDQAGARTLMEQVNMPPPLQKYYLRQAMQQDYLRQNPTQLPPPLSKSQNRQLQQMPPDVRGRIERDMGRHP